MAVPEVSVREVTDICNAYTLNQNITTFLLVDMQQRLKEAVYNTEEIIETQKKLVRAAAILDIPVMVSEQYPQGLGPTCEEISAVLEEVPRVLKFTKRQFSALAPKMSEELYNTGKRKIVMFGVETHVCIMQTARELMKSGYEPFVVADACSSRSELNHKFGLQVIHDMGIPIFTAEMILFDIMKTSTHPNFKEVQNLVK